MRDLSEGWKGGATDRGVTLAEIAMSGIKLHAKLILSLTDSSLVLHCQLRVMFDILEEISDKVQIQATRRTQSTNVGG